MDEFQQSETVVDAPVDAGHESYSQDTQYEPPAAGEPVDNEAVDAPKPDANVGEAIRKEVERREAQLRKQYEEKYAPVTQHSTYLEKRARQEGFSDVASYLQAIDELEQRHQIEMESQRMGVDPETYAQYFQPVNQEVNQLKQEVQTYRQEREQQSKQAEIKDKWGALYKDFPGLVETSLAFNEGKDPEWYNDTMKGYVNRGYDPADAYRLAHADTINRQKEQEVLARVTGRDGRQVLSSVDSPNNQQFDPANMSDEQIKDISARVQRGERITF